MRCIAATPSGAGNCPSAFITKLEKAKNTPPTVAAPRAVAISKAVGMPRYMLRRYCPPTSNRALVICPRLQQRTASISTAKTLPLSITAC